MCYSFLDCCYWLIYGRKRKGNSQGSSADDSPDEVMGDIGCQYSSDIKVVCDLFREINTTRHHTEEYVNSCLVLRRGDFVKLGMKFEGIDLSDAFNVKLRLSMECKHLASSRINIATVGIEDGFSEESWGMVVAEKSHEKCNIIVKIMIPVTAAIGRYKVDVLLPTSSSFILLHSFDVIILCNAWIKDDDVYLESEELRQEYVLCDTGIIYRGSANHGECGIIGTHWEFGQFEENVLDCVLVLLEKDKRLERQPLKSHRKQNSAAWLARVLSAVLNCQQDNGLLIGNWSGNYGDGVAPSSWFSSVDIYQKYYKTKEPVKYGQCWVFSGVMTTALRALGIPSRCVTNFDSAHDTDESMTIDVFESEDGTKMKELCDDSIWNFHVWNELWTKRKDLSTVTYDGWQAIDSTPQETSFSLYQMGPAPLTAIKNGDLYIQYDVGFVFAEVNADCVKWIVSKDASGNIVFKEAKCRNVTYIGKYISTKMVGEEKREDITNLYKHPERSSEERVAFQNAHNFGRSSEIKKGLLRKDEDKNDLEIDLITKPGTMIQNGTDIKCTIQIRNISNRPSTVNATVVVNTMEYTGRTKALVKRTKLENISIPAGENVERDILVNADEYVKKLSDLNFMKIVAIAEAQETKQQFLEDCKLQLFHAECIAIQFLDPVKAGQPTRVEITFTNRLNVHMTNLIYSINGRGLTRTMIQERRDLGVGQKERVVFRIIPFKAGKHRMLVDIDSKEVKDLRCSRVVECR